MKISILTIFPEMFDSVLQASLMGRAIQAGHIEINIINIRDFSENKNKNTDDYPFGGGTGMVMTAQPIVSAMAHAAASPFFGKRIYMSPRGKTLTQDKVCDLAKEDNLVILCGHYEGIDQRAIELCIDEEISIGDYILTGGEIGAMVLIDAVMRFVPGVLGSSESTQDESFSNSLLEYPQYTRPREYMGLSVPDVLLEGNHAKINQWRHEQSLVITKKNRPDLLARANISEKDRLFLKDYSEHGQGGEED